MEPIRENGTEAVALPKRQPLNERLAATDLALVPVGVVEGLDLVEAGDRAKVREEEPDSATTLADVSAGPPDESLLPVLTDPVFPEAWRHCDNCGSAVGRGGDGKSGDVTGACGACGTQFSFKPALAPGDVLGDRYEILGCLAHGATGWIYLAADQLLTGQWVVLKELRTTVDPAGIVLMAAEQQLLTGIAHPNLAKIHGLFPHPDPVTGGPVDHLVTEYVDGESLARISPQWQAEFGPAKPALLANVITCGLQILGALGHLHGLGLLYCDVKPANVIHTDGGVKLVDLDALRRISDRSSPILHTRGYSAPELAEQGASVASDIYAVGRTLAMLSIRFAGHDDKYSYTLPTPQEVPLFEQFDSYYRVLLRATHPDPARRFASAQEMAEQLRLTLCEVMALDQGECSHVTSEVFGPAAEDAVMTIAAPDLRQRATALPVVLVPPDDPCADLLVKTHSGKPADLIETLTRSARDSVAARLRMCVAWIELGDLARAFGDLHIAHDLAADPHDWRVQWHYGLIELAMGRPERARSAFDSVYSMLPGELAPKIALGICAELMRDYPTASRFHERVRRTDPYCLTAGFGLVRIYLARRAPRAAIEVLDSLPDKSPRYVEAQLAAIDVAVSAAEIFDITEDDLVAAGQRLIALDLDPVRHAQVSIKVLAAALRWIRTGGETDETGRDAIPTVIEYPLVERDVRRGLEECHRDLAAFAETRAERCALIDQANALRPFSFM